MLPVRQVARFLRGLLLDKRRLVRGKRDMIQDSLGCFDKEAFILAVIQLDDFWELALGLLVLRSDRRAGIRPCTTSLR